MPLNNVNEKCECETREWRLNINSVKIKVTIKLAFIQVSDMICDGEMLKIVNSFKYLGIVFNHNSSFKFALGELCKHASYFALCKLKHQSVII